MDYKKTIKKVQTIWVVILIVHSVIVSINNISLNVIALDLFTMSYIIMTAGIYKNYRFAWVLSICPPIMILLVFGTKIVKNLLFFFQGREPFLDSPATIFVVLITFLFTVVPSVMILSLFVLGRKQIFR